MMLLNGYGKKISRPACNPRFTSLHCIARLHDDVSPVLPFLNAALGGDAFLTDPPALTLMAYGKLITIEGRQIAINALKSDEEAEKILAWLMSEINGAWEGREEITPKYKGKDKPQILALLKMLPQTNCGECGSPTCMVFATLLAQGVRRDEDCPPLDETARNSVKSYLGPFDLES